jgi:hypothetical protein
MVVSGAHEWKRRQAHLLVFELEIGLDQAQMPR